VRGWALGLVGLLSFAVHQSSDGSRGELAGDHAGNARPLPRMDFSKGIPPECRTLVVVPTMLTSTQTIEDLVEALEVRFLANRDDHLHFGLLTDFPTPLKNPAGAKPLVRLASRESKS